MVKAMVLTTLIVCGADDVMMLAATSTVSVAGALGAESTKLPATQRYCMLGCDSGNGKSGAVLTPL